MGEGKNNYHNASKGVGAGHGGLAGGAGGRAAVMRRVRAELRGDEQVRAVQKRAILLGACQKQAWAKQKQVCVARPLSRRSVTDVVGLSVGIFGEDETCSWIRGKVKQWRDDAGVLELVQHLECLPLPSSR